MQTLIGADEEEIKRFLDEKKICKCFLYPWPNLLKILIKQNNTKVK